MPVELYITVPFRSQFHVVCDNWTFDLDGNKNSDAAVGHLCQGTILHILGVSQDICYSANIGLSGFGIGLRISFYSVSPSRSIPVSADRSLRRLSRPHGSAGRQAERLKVVNLNGTHRMKRCSRRIRYFAEMSHGVGCHEIMDSRPGYVLRGPPCENIRPVV